MSRRSVAVDLTPEAWPSFDVSALAKDLRQRFTSRRQAIELYVANSLVSAIDSSALPVLQQLGCWCSKCRIEPHAVRARAGRDLAGDRVR